MKRLGFLILLNVCLVIGAWSVLRPTSVVAQSAEPSAPTETSAGKTVRGIILRTEKKTVDGQQQILYHLRLTSGPHQGQQVVSGGDGGAVVVNGVIFQPGDHVYVIELNKFDGSTGYIVQDYDRLSSLWWLVAIFILIVIWFSRWRGLRSLLGLVLSFTIIIGWIVPQISAGHHPVWVTIVGSTVILVAGFLLTEGRTRLTAAAMLGTVITMCITGVLSIWAVRFTALSGTSSEETLYLQNALGVPIDLRGLLLAGIIIGTLGILDDIAVSQAAAVGELWTANPRLSRRDVYVSAMRIGRSHLVAIINTLTLAYAGSSLPLLVLFSTAQQSWATTINSEIVATEIVRSIIGSVGLILALPISTLAAAVIGVRSTHGHQHNHGATSPERRRKPPAEAGT